MGLSPFTDRQLHCWQTSHWPSPWPLLSKQAQGGHDLFKMAWPSIASKAWNWVPKTLMPIDTAPPTHPTPDGLGGPAQWQLLPTSSKIHRLTSNSWDIKETTNPKRRSIFNFLLQIRIRCVFLQTYKSLDAWQLDLSAGCLAEYVLNKQSWMS